MKTVTNFTFVLEVFVTNDIVRLQHLYSHVDDRHAIQRGYLFFSVKDRNLFHRVDTIGNILTSGAE